MRPWINRNPFAEHFPISTPEQQNHTIFCLQQILVAEFDNSTGDSS